jgi:cobalt-zinc-cadmium resistance protein CzcA
MIIGMGTPSSHNKIPLQLGLEKEVSRVPQVAFVFPRAGTPELAADPMPAYAADTYMIMKPPGVCPDPDLRREELIRSSKPPGAKSPGNALGFSQPIQIRFNELIAGVRQDLAIKIFGDEFAPMQRTASQIASVLRLLDGATDVKVEERKGCRSWTSGSTRRRSRAVACGSPMSKR